MCAPLAFCARFSACSRSVLHSHLALHEEAQPPVGLVALLYLRRRQSARDSSGTLHTTTRAPWVAAAGGFAQAPALSYSVEQSFGYWSKRRRRTEGCDGGRLTLRLVFLLLRLQSVRQRRRRRLHAREIMGKCEGSLPNGQPASGVNALVE